MISCTIFLSLVRDVANDRRERAAEGVRKEHAGQDEHRRDGDRYIEYRPELLYLPGLAPRPVLGCVPLLLRSFTLNL